MGAVIERKQTAFRLSIELLDKLKEEATKENRSLNNYVESLLMNIVYNRPNKQTINAMKEAKENRELETLDVNNLESIISAL